MKIADTTSSLEKDAALIQKSVLKDLENKNAGVIIVQAPPGSGKTYLLTYALARAAELGLRCAVATQTNSQADHICREMANSQDSKLLNAKVFRLGGSDTESPEGWPVSIPWITKGPQIPRGGSITVSTSAKWFWVVDPSLSFDIIFVEEAWQLKFADFLHLLRLAPRFVLIGDPGQIPPVVTIDPSRWETAEIPPHLSAPEVLLSARNKVSVCEYSLPATRRLPSDTKDLVQGFYDFEFGSIVKPGERLLITKHKPAGWAGEMLERFGTSSVVALASPTPEHGPPLERDPEIAEAAVNCVAELLKSKPTFLMNGKERPLLAEHIGLASTHRAMVSELELRIRDRKLGDKIVVDTPERWQGLQRPMMVVVHPLSGVVNPSEFDLQTGRLCVMASRHQVGLVVISRNHVPSTLRDTFPTGAHAPSRPDVTGRGHAMHDHFVRQLINRDAWIKRAG